MEETRAAETLQDATARLHRAVDASDEAAFVQAFNGESAGAAVVNSDGQTWLHVLLERGMVHAAQTVMTQCVVTAADRHGTTPLMIAAARGYADTCAQLLSADAGVDGTSVAAALALAIENQQVNVCRLLVSFDRAAATQALFAAIAKDAASNVNVLLSAGVSPDAKAESSKFSRYAVHDAVGRLSIMRALIRNGASVNVKDSDGRTPLSLAAARGDLLVCNLLLDEGAALEIKDLRGRSPMFYACASERDAVIKRFVGTTESVDTVDNLRRTPLFFHVERGNVNGCRMVLRHGANIFHKDTSKWTAIHVAASLGHKNVCRLLVDEVEAAITADPLLSDNADDGTEDAVFCKAMVGSTAWISVTPTTLLRVYSDLLAHGAKAVLSKYGTLLIRDFAMNTLLHLAVERAEDVQCVYLLRCLQSIGGVPVMSQNCHRESALDWAKLRGRQSAIGVLHRLADTEESGTFRVQLGGTISRSVGFPNGPTAYSSRNFTECSRPRLAQLSRGIESGVYSLSDEIVWQIDTEKGDTVLHYFIRDFCERPGPFPTTTDQQTLITSSMWLGSDPRVARVFLTKRNWEGKTPLHVAAEFGALGFSISLIEAGCHAGEECSAVDKRLVDPPNESTHYWKVVNFAAVMTDASSPPTLSTTETGSSERARDARAQRKSLVEFLLSRPDALPTQDSALVDLREKIYRFVPQLMPQLIGKMDTTWNMDDCAEAKQLYRKFLEYSYIESSTDPHSSGVSGIRALLADQSGIVLHKIFLESERSGLQVLNRYCVNECLIESTGDTLLHLVAAHGHSTGLGVLRYLLSEGGMNVNRRNKQYKTALHVACERQDTADTCMFLLSNGADVTAACQNMKSRDGLLWLTPLYCALWAPDPSLEVIEMLLTIPKSIVEPHHPRLGRSDVPQRGGTTSARWNETLLRRLVQVHPGALPLFLDHFAVEVNRLNGGMLYRFTDVRHACRDLDLMLQPSTAIAQLHHKYSPSPCVTHPVIRNAIHLKWKLFGQLSHRRQLALYVLMLVFFYLANVVLPKIDAVFNSDAPVLFSSAQYKWLDFASPVDYAVAVCKGACWLLAAYHLIYVELYLEWRADRGRYWRSLWNLLDIGTYIIMLATIPLEFCSGALSVLRECLLGVLSVLLCVNLMQTLLVSSFFSVLIFTFARMCRVVAQFFFHYLLLLVGFAGGFHLLLHGYGPHVNFISTMRVVFLAMFGELNYMENFYARDASPARNVCGFLLLVLYVVVVMIVALNLLTALMTSEYEHVRSQAEERALLELTGALQRYEQWLGPDVIASLYDSPRGAALLQACERRIATHDTRRGRDDGKSSFEGLERWRRLAHRRGYGMNAATTEPSVPTAAIGSRSRSHLGGGGGDGNAVPPLVAMDAVGDALAAEVSRRVADETAALRVEMETKLQQILDAVAAAASHAPAASATSTVLGRSASARDVAHVEAKLDALLASLHAHAPILGTSAPHLPTEH